MRTLLKGAGICFLLSISTADSPDVRVPCILVASSLALMLLAMVAGEIKEDRERRAKRNIAVQHHRERMREARALRKSSKGH